MRFRLGVLMLCGVALGGAQTPASRAIYASDFNAWRMVTLRGVPAPGVATVTLSAATVAALGGQTVPAVAASAPLLVDPGPNQETVMPTPACASGGSPCTFTATFARAHPGHFQIASGSDGLQEAIDYAHAHGGGIVVLDQRWGGDAAMLAAATGFSDVLVRDDRVPVRWLQWTSAGYTPVWSLGPAGAAPPPPMQYGGLTDGGPTTLASAASTNLAAGGFQSALRLSIFANQGGTYGMVQPNYPIINGEAVGRTQGQVGGLFTFNQGFGFSNVQGLSGISKCWGGAEPTAGGSYVQCSAMGEQDIEAPTAAAVVSLSGAPAVGATSLSYTPLANENVAGARQWFDVSQPETVGNAQPSGCGIASVQGHAWTLTGSGCGASASWVGKYLIPNTTQFWYSATGGACAGSPSDYSTDNVNCIGTPFLITSVGSSTSLGTFAALDAQGLVDMRVYASAGPAARSGGTVTLALAAIPDWGAGTEVQVSACSDSSFDGSFALAAAGASAPLDTQVSYTQAGSDATASGCVVQHVPIPFVVVDGILASDVDIVHHVLTLPPNSKAWAANDELVSPPTPWVWTVGLNLNIAKNYPAANMQNSLAPLGDGIRIRALGPFPLTYGLEFYGSPPVGAGGIDTLIGVQPGFGPIQRGLDVSAQSISDCAVCIGASSDGHANKIKFGNLGEGDGQIYYDGALELRGPAAGSVRIGDVAGASAWTFAHAPGQVTVTNAQGQQILRDTAGQVQVGNASGGVVLGDGAGAPVKGHYSTTATLTPSAPGAVPGCAPDLQVALGGAVVGSSVELGVPVPWAAGQIAQAWVNSPGQVSIRICQFAGAATAPTAGLYRVDAWLH